MENHEYYYFNSKLSIFFVGLRAIWLDTFKTGPGKAFGVMT